MTDNGTAPLIRLADVRAGNGDEWDFERYGPLWGFYVGESSITVERKPGQLAEQPIWQFEPIHPAHREVAGPLVFAWGSYQLDRAMEDTTEDGTPVIREGDLVVVTFLGRHEIKSGKQQLNRYRVQVVNDGQGRPVTRDSAADILAAAIEAAAGVVKPAVAMAGEKLAKAAK